MIVVGINYKNTPLTLREKFYFTQAEIAELQKSHMPFPFVILSTCNRTEIYFKKKSSTHSELKKQTNKLITILLQYKKLPKKEIMNFFYIFYSEKAIYHLFKVAAGLNSMILGENQILGQIKEAYNFSFKNQQLPAYFNKIFQEAITVGKKARSKTAINRGGSSLGSVTIDIIKNVFPNQKKLKILVFGAGEIAQEVLNNLKNLNLEKVKVYITTRTNKTNDHFLAEEKIEWINLNNKKVIMRECDIVIAATSTKNYVVHYEEYVNELKSNFKPRLFIDLGVPRNIDPKIKTLEDTILYTLDDLKGTVNQNYQKRIGEVNQVKKIIDEHLINLEKWRVKKDFLKTYSILEKQIKLLPAKRRKKYLITLSAFKKNLPETKMTYEEKLNSIILFFLNENINLKI